MKPVGTKTLKVMTVVGTRPEIIRLSRVIAKLDIDTDHVLVHTGQNYDYELNEIFFKELRVPMPAFFLDAAGKTAAETIGQVIIKLDPILEKVAPDAVLILGDTNSSLSAIPAKRRKIPIFHMEAGNRCFDMRVPEEINRRIVDHVADMNLVYSELARTCLLREGLPLERVIKTGSPMFEVLEHYEAGIEKSKILADLGLQADRYFVVSSHREENVDSDANISRLGEICRSLAETYQVPVVFSTHPRTRKRFEAVGINFPPEVKLLKPLGFFDYVKLQVHARASLSDSGTITEESSILNFPALNLREAHERHEGMDEGAVMMVGLSLERVHQALAILAHQKRGPNRTLRLIPDYDVPNVSEKVVRLIVSYVDYVNRFVWKKI